MSQNVLEVSNETLKFEEIHKGKLVKDKDGDIGKVVCSSDIHNIKVKLSKNKNLVYFNRLKPIKNKK